MMKITVKKLAELHEPPKNIRRHTEKQLKEYVRSIEMFGQIKPLLIDEEGEILAGNGLYQALLRAGKETADCYIIKGLDENGKKKLMLADNRIFELGMTDTSIFEDIIKELDGDIDVPGWDEDLLETINASMERTMEEIDSYGSFEPTQVQTISNKESFEHQAQTIAPANYEPVSVTHKYDEAVNTAAVTPQPIAANESEDNGRYIICPQCGKKICL